MLRRTTVLTLAAGLWIVSAYAQAPAREAAFEVAAIKRSAPRQPRLLPGAGTVVRTQPGGRWMAQNSTLALILMMTYGLQPQQLIGGPDWVRTERFDITAKAAINVSEQMISAMVKRLLADRFKLRLRKDERRSRVYALERVRSDRLGPGLRPRLDCADETAPKTTNGSAPPCGRVVMNSVDGVTQLRVYGQPVINVLSLAGVRGSMDAPLVDRTGLTGMFDVALDYVPFSQPEGKAVNGVTAIVAIQDQLGLKLTRQQAAIDVMVIEQVEMPTFD